MKSFLLAALFTSTWFTTGEGSLNIMLNGKEWKQSTVMAGVQKVMNIHAFTIIAQKDKERFDISVDYNALKGKSSASFTLIENMMMPPGGASISYAPAGLGRQQWFASAGKLNITEFNESTHTASGNFEATITQILDDKGGLVISNRPSQKVSGTFSKIPFTKVN